MKASARIKEKRLGRFSPPDLPEQIRAAENRFKRGVAGCPRWKGQRATKCARGEDFPPLLNLNVHSKLQV
ncbi:hypothetical protein HMPREF0860_1310 [Treponema socranskii subsp. socranskii VPI DR56BR1116 = ATCC 35536]|uniref:Uncharacterized protein n=1 Tax=Treponema socranskii subsp. socranskii VPI DR56BR1116 = ATCC 35536 TaxID=1125725 RepID=U2MZW3_TRESO|nr:hypothetical protein HMPREF1325_1932 [Treponema socranskii subsp. socranskii VPI DR56BR1116 = ATCC 35536]ERK04744.1 hypothetical protein HMPREF0860_1310 [Treponema socranskii subsp. socranskii VPI DR56BR1116 = ATCC 35536]